MLSNIKINQNTAKVPFPREKDFVVEIKYLPRDELAKIREKNSAIKFDRVTRARADTVDTDKFMDEYIKKSVVGWEGLTFDLIRRLVPIEVDEHKLTTVIPYSHEDAMWLVKNSGEFDSFISDTMQDIDVFSTIKREENQKK